MKYMSRSYSPNDMRLERSSSRYSGAGVVLPFGNTQIDLVFRSLNRNFETLPRSYFRSEILK